MNNYLTDRLPGTGGTIKLAPEDFRVEELPLYLPCGEGEHLYLEVEKWGLTTFEMVHRLARALGVKERDFGYAGLKDARAATRQTVSISGIAPETALALQLEGIRILAARRHRNKLRLGHLSGNRFVIRIREVESGAAEKALDIFHVLADLGVPNRFGPQRYGSLGNSDRVGLALVQGDYPEAVRQVLGVPERIANPRWRQAAAAFAGGDLEGALRALPGRFRDERRLLLALQEGKSPRDAVLGLPRQLLRLYLSALQASLFDRMVVMRLATLGTLWSGDLAYKHGNGACFTVQDPAAEQPRADAFEISPSGPLFGHRMTMARGQAGILEEALLASSGLQLAEFKLDGGLAMEGERRPLRVPLKDPAVRRDPFGLVLEFSLPKGSYATSVLAEVMKPPGADSELDADSVA